MPWGNLGRPSLALGILRSAAERSGHDVQVRYANLDFMDWASAEMGFSVTDYMYFSEKSYFQGVGDWAFAGALYADDEGQEFRRYFEYLRTYGANEREVELARAIRMIAPQFVAHLIEEIAGSEPDLVGFTTTFQQNTASLAAAKLLKQSRPQVRVVMGGANCDGPQGAALHRNFPFVDYIVRGEGEAAFPLLLEALSDAVQESATSGSPDAQQLAAIPGLCWRDESEISKANPMATSPLPPTAILRPRYDGFFERLETSVANAAEPMLVLEGARGCWWGQKHHCTFCGLNGSSMQFRSKRPEDFLAEVLDLVERHRVLDVCVVDNIMDMDYFDTVLRSLAELSVDLRLYFEVKSNLRRHQFQMLIDAGAVQVQPGIENLSTRVLRIMDKGVTGCQNVRALRDAQSAGVSVEWNYLYGFPGEQPSDYESIIRQIPLLYHLDPPGGITRIAVERFSPYFNQPELGFDTIRPAFQYGETYRLPAGELADLAYIFHVPQRGIDSKLARTLTVAVDIWRDQYPDSRLTYQDSGDHIVLVNTRRDYDWEVAELTDPVELALFRLLSQPRSATTLAVRTPGAEARVTPLVERWTAMGLLFHDNGSCLHVAAEANNQVLMRMKHRHRNIESKTSTEGERDAVSLP